MFYFTELAFLYARYIGCKYYSYDATTFKNYRKNRYHWFERDDSQCWSTASQHSPLILYSKSAHFIQSQLRDLNNYYIYKELERISWKPTEHIIYSKTERKNDAFISKRWYFGNETIKFSGTYSVYISRYTVGGDRVLDDSNTIRIHRKIKYDSTKEAVEFLEIKKKFDGLTRALFGQKFVPIFRIEPAKL